MAARIEFGTVATIRAGVRNPSRYVVPPSFHVGAAWLAAAVPLLAILVVIGAR